MTVNTPIAIPTYFPQPSGTSDNPDMAAHPAPSAAANRTQVFLTLPHHSGVGAFNL